MNYPFNGQFKLLTGGNNRKTLETIAFRCLLAFRLRCEILSDINEFYNYDAKPLINSLLCKIMQKSQQINSGKVIPIPKI